jgi:hypothetical protein
LSGTQFSTLTNAGINSPKGPEKYNNTGQNNKKHETTVGKNSLTFRG